MAASVRVTLSGKDLASQIAVPDAEWRNLGNLLRTRLIQRTRRGTDAQGRTFASYSTSYAKAKAEAGGNARVDLTSREAGRHMLDDIAVSVPTAGQVKVELTFASADKATIARYHMGEGRVDREFFALGDDDTEASIAYLRKRLAAKP